MYRSKFILLATLAALLQRAIGKRTYTVTEEEVTPKKLLKSPQVSKYDARNCLFDDSVNYLCLEHTIDLKAGWEIK